MCDVMVCASEHQFTHSGEAKTHAAAVTLAAAAAAAAAAATGSLPMAESAAVAESGGMFPTSDGSVAPMAVYESCEGYTSQNWQTCPAGYKVGTTSYIQILMSCCRPAGGPPEADVSIATTFTRSAQNVVSCKFCLWYIT